MRTDFLETVYGEIKTRHEETGGKGYDVIGVPTGFKEIDDDTGGFRNDSVNIIAARTGMGKTAMALSIVLYQLAKGYKVAYLSLEMSERMMILRLVSMLTGISPIHIERGKIGTDQKLAEVRAAIEYLSPLPLDIIDKGVASDQLTDFFYNNYPDRSIYYIDHMGILRDTVTDQYTKMSIVSNNIRACARDLDKPIVSVAQLNRAVDGRENHIPSNHDLRDSGKIEEDAETIMMVKRNQYYVDVGVDDGNEVLPGQAERDASVYLTKNRYGPQGLEYKLWFYPHRTLWTDRTEPIVLPSPHPQPPTRVAIPKAFTSGNLVNMAREGR